MTISVVIPTLNEAQNIRAALARLHHPAFGEILVGDGGSDDGTVAQAAPVAKVLTAPRGRARQMNVGAAAASGDALLFLHADTLLPPTAVDDITTALADPRVVGGHFAARIAPDRGLLWLVGRMMSWRARLTGIATGDQAIFVRRAAFHAVGRFPAIALMEDIALCRHLKNVSKPLRLRERVTTSGRRWEKNGILKTIGLMWGLRLAYFFGADPKKLAQRYGYE